MNRLFLTGGTGFLGRHIFERWDESSFLYSRGQDLEKLWEYNPHFIIHCAAEIYDESKMFESNVELTHKLLDLSRQLDNLKAFIYVGSSSEYGRKNKPIKETDLLEPETIYEATKGMGSLLCQSYASTYGMPVMVARPFSLYGRHEPKHRLIPTAIKHVKAGWEIKVSPGCHDFIHVDDFINGLFMLLHNPQPGQIYNFGTGFQYTNEEVVDIISRIVKRDAVKVMVGKMRPYDSNMWVCDYSKAKALGWNPTISFKGGIRDLCRRT